MTWLTIILTKRQGLQPGQVQNEFCIGYRHVSWLSALPLASKEDKGTLVFLHQRNFNKNFKEDHTAGAPLGLSQDGCKTKSKIPTYPLLKDKNGASSGDTSLFNALSKISAP